MADEVAKGNDLDYLEPKITHAAFRTSYPSA